MTILSEPTSATAAEPAPDSPSMIAPDPHTLMGVIDPAVSDSRLLAWIAERAGFPGAAAIASDFPAHALVATTPCRFGIHLTRPVSAAALLRAMNALRGKDPCSAILLVSDEPPEPAYRERLHLDATQKVLGIRRHFTSHGTRPHRPRFLGVAWRVGARLHELQVPLPGAGCWRTLRAVLRLAPAGAVRRVAVMPESSDTFRSHLLAELSPQSLRALAACLGYEAVRPYCFAHPAARVTDTALLRGPLFIDRDAVVHAHQVHIGPGWIARKSPDFTIAAHPRLRRAQTQRRSHPAPAASHVHPHEYFIGPAARHHPRYDRFKRLFDFLFAFAVLTLTLPICLAVALLIKLYDRGPIFFIHTREGRHARPFGCMKFRTMVRNAEAIKQQLRATNQVDGPQFKMANDPRITPIGRFLRKSNIDELPQLLNVLRGDMSIVGPRPSPFDENQLCPGWREARLSVKPGITGLWQISRSRHRGAADFQEWIFFDTQYVERRSFWLDFRILLLTIKELFGKGQ